MILLVWSSERIQECASAIERAFHEPVRVVSTWEQACDYLKTSEFSAVVLDQWISDGTAGDVDLMFQHLSGVVPVVVVNFAISGMERVVRQVRSALERSDLVCRLARENATSAIHAELKDDMTALLLSCGLALEEPTLTEAAADRVRRIDEIANGIRQKLLQTGAQQASCAAHA